MGYVIHFRCFKCGNTHTLTELEKMPIMRCSKCNSALDIEYDYDSVKRVILREDFKRSNPSHWKYWAFMPVKDLSKIVTMGEGGTPLLENRNLTKKIGSDRLLFKYEAMNPTGSFKDRGSSLEITKAIEFGKKRVILASTGNMGASIAAYSAFVGLECNVLVPSMVSSAKLKQIKAYGANLKEIDGDYSVAMKRAEEYVLQDRSSFLTGDYPWRCEGTKTIGFEIVDQLYWSVPDYVIAPIGNGTLIWGIYRAFLDMKAVGIIHKIPKFIGVQVYGCNPVIHAWETKARDVIPIENPKTIATAIACGDPIDGLAALRAIRESYGIGVSVSDKEVLSARNELGSNGIFVEPSGAVAYAGARKIRNVLFDKTVVCLATGHGLKDMYGI